MPGKPRGAEADRLAASGIDWREFGPYLAERAWGTVREDYSADGDAWSYLPYEDSRSRTYRWSEDGIAGWSDRNQLVCLSVGLWNGRDPHLKERLFGLANAEGNHGEDAKEYWWFQDATPTHSWCVYEYLYPLDEFPYQKLRDVNRTLSRDDPEYELVDAEPFGLGAALVRCTYAKADWNDTCLLIEVENLSDRPAAVNVLAQVTLRNLWSWGSESLAFRPRLYQQNDRIAIEHPRIGPMALSSSGQPKLLFCENESNLRRLFGVDSGSPYPKDGINDHVVSGLPTVNPAQEGTKAAFWHQLSLDARQRASIRIRLVDGASINSTAGVDLADGFDAILTQREQEADEFYDQLLAETPLEHRLVARRALASMIWSKQFYHLDVGRWLEGDPAQPPPPETRQSGRNSKWGHLVAKDIISMPDTFEYPWFAAWDLAFHATVFAHLDPAFAKEQLLLLGREWYMSPTGQLPAYEWDFSDVNPPVQAWAALNVFRIDGRGDLDFLERIFHKLLINFTWWVNMQDSGEANIFEGGFLGLDNIAPFDRSVPLGQGNVLEQADGTAWMAFFCLGMLEISLILAADDPTYEDLATKFLEHFAYISSAMYRQGLYDDETGFFYDRIRRADGSHIKLACRSMVGLVPLFAVTVIDRSVLESLPNFTERMNWFRQNRLSLLSGCLFETKEHLTLSLIGPVRLQRILAIALSEDEMLSPFGLRSLSRYHLDHPLEVNLDGRRLGRVDYEPAESHSGLFGGNSNWRGPVWLPMNHLAIQALRRLNRGFGHNVEVEYPTGSGTRLSLNDVADDLVCRLARLYQADSSGITPSQVSLSSLSELIDLSGRPMFFEYFDGDTGKGLGASHQTGWTGLLAHHLIDRHPESDQPDPG
jgi:hypothetical protein